MLKKMVLHLLPRPASWRMLARLSVALEGCTTHAVAGKAAWSASESTRAGAVTASGADARFVAIARGRVDVPGGLLRVAAPYGGMIEHWGVEAGTAVKQGQVLVQLNTREPRTALELAKAEHARAVAHRREGRVVELWKLAVVDEGREVLKQPRVLRPACARAPPPSSPVGPAADVGRNAPRPGSGMR